VFDSDVEINEEGAVQRMKFCALVEAWKEMGCTPEEIELFCDIAMKAIVAVPTPTVSAWNWRNASPGG